jgi:hypothetical protein
MLINLPTSKSKILLKKQSFEGVIAYIVNRKLPCNPITLSPHSAHIPRLNT